MGPMEKGMIYMVLPLYEPRAIEYSFSYISAGSHQLFVGPAFSLVLEQINVLSSTRATSLGRVLCR